MLSQERAMNKSYIKSCIFAVVLVALVPCFALAATPPHDTDSDCYIKCHQTHKTLGATGYNNICLNCHRYGSSDPRYAQIYPYIVTDQAKQDGPSLGVLKTGSMQSSHRWEGSDNNPRVGAVPPTNPALMGPDPTNPAVANLFVNNLYCGRCHAVHGTTGYVDSVSPPFLRVQNNEDQMCLDCHRPRNVSSQEYGSHPVNINYSSIAKRKSGEYFYPPVNSNPANKTSSMKIINGKVLCSTCHGVHHSDSNSRTMDNFSSVIFNGLSSSKGYLLRSDLRGRTSTDANICTNCHKTVSTENPDAKVKNHNGTLKQQNIQCSDCHGAHIDEAQLDADAGGTKTNAFLIKRFMSYSSANSNGRNPKVIFLYTSISKRNYNTTTFGVCLACHKKLPDTIEQHKQPTSATTCEQCHTHKAGFSANCTDCHGMPPREDNVGGPKGYAKGYVGVQESKSPHQSHAAGTSEFGNNYYVFSCNDCHKAPQVQAVPQHGNNNYQDLFKSPNGTKAGVYAVYNTTNRTCSMVYCHSNGLPAGGLPPDNAANYKSVTWGDIAVNSIIAQPHNIRCSSCHEAEPTTNAHTKHLNNGLLNGCVTCHSNTVDSNKDLLTSARLTGGTHVNGYKDISFSGSIGGQILDGIDCSNVYCHSDGKFNKPVVSPVWSNPATGACGTCHFATNVVRRSDDSHFTHFSAVYGPKLVSKVAPASCNICHMYPTGHVNGVANAPSNDKCSTNCHKSADVLNWKNPGPAAANRLSCESCHTAGQISVFDGILAPDKTASTTLGHGKSSGANKVCLDCHDPNSAHISSDPNSHAKRLKVELLSQPGMKNPECNYCHSNPAIVSNSTYRNMSTHFMPNDYGQTSSTMSCYYCHDIHGTSNIYSLRTSLVTPVNSSFKNSTTWSIDYTDNNLQTSFVLPNGRGLCQVCHTQTQFYRAGALGETHNSTINCLTCHKHNTSKGAFAAIGGGCDGCHGYPPVPKSSLKMSKTDPLYASTYKSTYGFAGNFSSARLESYSGGGGAHLNHVPDFARPSDGWARCAVCHAAGDTATQKPATHKMTGNLHLGSSNLTINIDPALSFNGNPAQIIYSGARLTNVPNNRTGSCMNISCHFQPTPRWSKEK